MLPLNTNHRITHPLIHPVPTLLFAVALQSAVIFHQPFSTSSATYGHHHRSSCNVQLERPAYLPTYHSRP